MRALTSVLFLLLAAGPSSARTAAGAAAVGTPLVTGNGFGFAVFSNSSGTITKLYAHPYSFERPDPKDALAEGVETTNFIRSLSWTKISTAPASYLDESHILTAGKAVYFMPFGLDRNALIAFSTSTKAKLKIVWAHRVVSDHGGSPRVFGFEGIPESIAVVRLSTAAWAFLPLEPGDSAEQAAGELARWRGALSPEELEQRELREFESWRAKPAVRFRSENERKLWRQSETVLRMAQSREPNRKGRWNHGMIVACLPDGAWFMTWVRDMSYAAQALLRMGHSREARWALEAYFNAQPTGKMQREVGDQPYQISVARYFGDGSEEPFFTMEGSTNIEFDDWGLVLKLLGDYVERSGDATLLSAPSHLGSVYGAAKTFVARPLIANLEPFKDGLLVKADTSIWEERQKDKKHFAFSSAAALAGLRAMQRLARSMGDDAFEQELKSTTQELDIGFRAAFVRDGWLHGTLEPGVKNDVDGAALAALALLDWQDRALWAATVKKMSALKEPSGGWRRVTCILKDPKIYEYYYERQEFVFTDFDMAKALFRLGRGDEAEAVIARVAGKTAADRYFIPEMYVSVVNPRFEGPLGAPTGAIPMVGYGAGAYVLTLAN